MLRWAVVGEPLQGWHIMVLSEAARYGWQPPVREPQRKKDPEVFTPDVNAAAEFLITRLPDQYGREVEHG